MSSAAEKKLVILDAVEVGEPPDSLHVILWDKGTHFEVAVDTLGAPYENDLKIFEVLDEAHQFFQLRIEQLVHCGTHLFQPKWLSNNDLTKLHDKRLRHGLILYPSNTSANIFCAGVDDRGWFVMFFKGSDPTAGSKPERVGSEVIALQYLREMISMGRSNHYDS